VGNEISETNGEKTRAYQGRKRLAPYRGKGFHTQSQLGRKVARLFDSQTGMKGATTRLTFLLELVFKGGVQGRAKGRGGGRWLVLPFLLG